MPVIFKGASGGGAGRSTPSPLHRTQSGGGASGGAGGLTSRQGWDVVESARGLLPWLRRAYKRYHLKHLLPLFVTLLYMCGGALLFLWLEQAPERQRVLQRQADYTRERDLLVKRIGDLVSSSTRPTGRRNSVESAFARFQNALQWQPVAEPQWSFTTAMYFSGTVFTTIGYGDVACVTGIGRVATVIYAIIGVPLFLVSLTDLGKFLYCAISGICNRLNLFWLSVRRRLCGAKVDRQLVDVEAAKTTRRESEDVSTAILGEPSEAGSKDGSVEDLDKDPGRSNASKNAPRMSVKVAIGSTVAWIFICAALFKIWERDWTYAEACYFFVISNLTIGFGDVAVTRRDMMVLSFLFVIIGLALVSMCIQVIQVAVEDLYFNLILKLAMEYQKTLEEGGDAKGASMGMLSAWSGNRTAKYLMPLLSADKRRTAMARVEKEAKEQGITLPPILTHLDSSTGLPALFEVENEPKASGAAPDESAKRVEQLMAVAEAEHLQQQQPQQQQQQQPPQPVLPVQRVPTPEDLSTLSAVCQPTPVPPPPAPPVIPVHDEGVQTELIRTVERAEQTAVKEFYDEQTQTTEEDAEPVPAPPPPPRVETADAATSSEPLSLADVDVQAVATGRDAHTNTTQVTTEGSEMQTDRVETTDDEVQTYIIELVDAEGDAYTVETRNERIQTPQPIMGAWTAEVDHYEEERRSPSKMEAAKQRLRRAFLKRKGGLKDSPVQPAMSDWQDVQGEDAESEAESFHSQESLHWDPVDGLHAEPQKPVHKLRALFDTRAKAVPPPNSSRPSTSGPTFAQPPPALLQQYQQQQQQQQQQQPQYKLSKPKK